MSCNHDYVPTQMTADTTVKIFRLLADIPGTPASTGVNARIRDDYPTGQAAVSMSNLGWSHVMDVDDSVDIRDGCTRTAGTSLQNYSDGDFITDDEDSDQKYVVVWVEFWGEFKRCYLLEHN